MMIAAGLIPAAVTRHILIVSGSDTSPVSGSADATLDGVASFTDSSPGMRRGALPLPSLFFRSARCARYVRECALDCRLAQSGQAWQ
jgi:hypothetical protein